MLRIMSAILLALLAGMVFLVLTSITPKAKITSLQPLPRFIWRVFWLPLLIQALVALAAVIAILVLVRERIIR